MKMGSMADKYFITFRIGFRYWYDGGLANVEIEQFILVWDIEFGTCGGE